MREMNVILRGVFPDAERCAHAFLPLKFPQTPPSQQQPSPAEDLPKVRVGPTSSRHSAKQDASFGKNRPAIPTLNPLNFRRKRPRLGVEIREQPTAWDMDCLGHMGVIK